MKKICKQISKEVIKDFRAFAKLQNISPSDIKKREKEFANAIVKAKIKLSDEEKLVFMLAYECFARLENPEDVQALINLYDEMGEIEMSSELDYYEVIKKPCYKKFEKTYYKKNPLLASLGFFPITIAYDTMHSEYDTCIAYNNFNGLI